MDRLKNILIKPIFLAVLLLVTIICITSFAIVSNMNEHKAELVSSLDIDNISTDADTGKLSVKLIDYEEKQKEEYNTITEKLDSVANPEKSITDKISEYVISRYNFNDGAKSHKKDVLSTIEEFSTEQFREYVSESIDDDKNKESNAEIVMVFHNGRNLDTLNSSTDELMYIYIVDINGEQEVLQIVVKSESGIWKLNSEKKIDTWDKEIE